MEKLEIATIFLAAFCGYFYNEIRELKQRIEELESKVYDLKENTDKKKKDWEI